MRDKEGILTHIIQERINPDGTEGNDRESYYLTFKGIGSVEAWRTKSGVGREWTDSGYFGGVEVHSKTERDYHHKSEGCWVTGGACWTTGSSLAFYDVENDFDNPAYIRSFLQRFAENNLLEIGG